MKVMSLRKKTIVLIMAGVVLVIIGGAMIMSSDSSKPLDVSEFDLKEYQWELETYPSDRSVGQVNDQETAIQIARLLWVEEYSTIGSQPHNPINGREIEVSYDPNNECWHINGTVPLNTLGGVPHAIVQKDGKVLAIWYDD